MGSDVGALNAVAEDRTDEAGWFSRHHQAAWIAAGATVVAALVGALVPLLASSDDDDEPAGGTEPVAAPPSTPASTPDLTSAPPSADPTAPDPTSPAAGSERWQGRLLLDSGPKDLDTAPPEGVGYSDDGDIFVLGTMHVGGWNDTLISLWAGDPADPPGYEECASTIDAEGTDGQDVDEDSVLCVRTSDGNLARLTFLESQAGSDHTITFDAVVWEWD